MAETSYAGKGGGLEPSDRRWWAGNPSRLSDGPFRWVVECERRFPVLLGLGCFPREE